MVESTMSKTATRPKLLPDPEVVPRPKRRTFPAEYKAKILAECDAGLEPVGAILRREGLYSSLLADWRGQRAAGLAPKKTGRPLKDPIVREQREEIERLKRENAKLLEKVRRAEIIADAQKKLAEVLTSLRAATGNTE